MSNPLASSISDDWLACWLDFMLIEIKFNIQIFSINEMHLIENVVCDISVVICRHLWVNTVLSFNMIMTDLCVLLFDKSLILGCLWPLVFVLNNTFILGIWCSTIPHLPGCFCPWTFFENIGFNTVLTDPFMSHLATQFGYSAGEFQALQLIVLAAFGFAD